MEPALTTLISTEPGEGEGEGEGEGVRVWWLVCNRITVRVVTNSALVILDAAPVIKAFKSQPLFFLTNWLQGKGYRLSGGLVQTEDHSTPASPRVILPSLRVKLRGKRT